jgi:hypothetical protein
MRRLDLFSNYPSVFIYWAFDVRKQPTLRTLNQFCFFFTGWQLVLTFDTCRFPDSSDLSIVAWVALPIGRHLKRYSIIAITLRYDFALSHNAFTLSNSYHAEHIGPVIAYYSYRSDIIDKRYRIYWLSLLGKMAFKSNYNNVLFYFLRKKYIWKY